MTKTKDRLKKEQEAEIAARKVHKAERRTRDIDKKLKKAKKKNEDKLITDPLKNKLTNAFKRLKRNQKQLKKAEQKIQ